MKSLTEYFSRISDRSNGPDVEIHSCPELIECIRQVGFLPLLDSGVQGFCAEALLAEECRFVQFDDGSWEWPLWQWKGPVVTDGSCVYGKFFGGKAGFVSREWWPPRDNWRRSRSPEPEEGSVEDVILSTLSASDSLITRELRAACGFTGPKMRGKFDAYVTRLQMACRIVTEDFVYPTDRHGREYGFGWSLLTTPERLLGAEACRASCAPEESFRRMHTHLTALLPHASERQLLKLLG